jgi:hypothetical protein
MIKTVCTGKSYTEAESKEKHSVWDPTQKLTIQPHIMSTPESTPVAGGPVRQPYTGVDFFIPQLRIYEFGYSTFTIGNPMPELTLTLCHAKRHLIWRQILRNEGGGGYSSRYKWHAMPE